MHMVIYYVFKLKIRRQRDSVQYQYGIIIHDPGYKKFWNTEYFENVELYLVLNWIFVINFSVQAV
jgi:hypothetical protein